MDKLTTSTMGLAEAWMEHVVATREAVRAMAAEIVPVSPLRDYWGDDPHLANPRAPASDFKPRYIALLYLRLQPGWTLDVNHACYRLPEETEATADTRRDKALAILTDKVARDVSFGEQNLTGHLPYEHQNEESWEDDDRRFDSGTLEEFRFGSQVEIFILLHHPQTEVRVFDTRLLGFKTHGAVDGKLKYPNDTFYNARAIPADGLPPPLDNGDDFTLIRVENYATDVSSTMAEPRVYAMDIKFLIRAGSGWVTMIVDPDTGNGTGNEP